jgi:hypothetical protein
MKSLVAYATISNRGDVEVLLEGEVDNQIPRHRVIVCKQTAAYNTLCLKRLLTADSIRREDVDNPPS